MTSDVSEPIAELHALRSSTADLVKGLGEQGWSEDDVRAASWCEGWTRAHVLTHLARHADGVAGTLSGALRGEVVARYPGGRQQREDDIAAGALRPAGELLTDVVDSAERLDRVLGAVTDAGAWGAATDDGVAADWVWRRLIEVEVHRVDLRGDYTPDRWPPLLVGRLLPERAAAVSPDVRLEVDGGVVPDLHGRTWGDGDRLLRGPDWALLAWVLGRGDAVTAALDDRHDHRST